MPENNELPNPGSEAAIARGCACPAMDNNYGTGVGNGLFWINAQCPLHQDPVVPVKRGPRPATEAVKAGLIKARAARKKFGRPRMADDQVKPQALYRRKWREAKKLRASLMEEK